MFGLLNRIIGNEETSATGVGGGGGGFMPGRGASGFSLGGSATGGSGPGLGFLSTPRPTAGSGMQGGMGILTPRTPQGSLSGLRMPAPAAPPPSSVPEVDMSGLTEEEKALIQSVMIRAQEVEATTPTASPSIRPSAPSKSTSSSDSLYFGNRSASLTSSSSSTQHPTATRSLVVSSSSPASASNLNGPNTSQSSRYQAPSSSSSVSSVNVPSSEKDPFAALHVPPPISHQQHNQNQSPQQSSYVSTKQNSGYISTKGQPAPPAIRSNSQDAYPMHSGSQPLPSQSFVYSSNQQIKMHPNQQQNQQYQYPPNDQEQRCFNDGSQTDQKHLSQQHEHKPLIRQRSLESAVQHQTSVQQSRSVDPLNLHLPQQLIHHQLPSIPGQQQTENFKNPPFSGHQQQSMPTSDFRSLNDEYQSGQRSLGQSDATRSAPQRMGEQSDIRMQNQVTYDSYSDSINTNGKFSGHYSSGNLNFVQKELSQRSQQLNSGGINVETSSNSDQRQNLHEQLADHHQAKVQSQQTQQGQLIQSSSSQATMPPQHHQLPQIFPHPSRQTHYDQSMQYQQQQQQSQIHQQFSHQESVTTGQLQPQIKGTSLQEPQKIMDTRQSGYQGSESSQQLTTMESESMHPKVHSESHSHPQMQHSSQNISNATTFIHQERDHQQGPQQTQQMQRPTQERRELIQRDTQPMVRPQAQSMSRQQHQQQHQQHQQHQQQQQQQPHNRPQQPQYQEHQKDFYGSQPEASSESFHVPFSNGPHDQAGQMNDLQFNYMRNQAMQTASREKQLPNIDRILASQDSHGHSGHSGHRLAEDLSQPQTTHQPYCNQSQQQPYQDQQIQYHAQQQLNYQPSVIKGQHLGTQTCTDISISSLTTGQESEPMYTSSSGRVQPQLRGYLPKANESLSSAIPRTVPLQSVREQLAPSLSPSSSPKHKSQGSLSMVEATQSTGQVHSQIQQMKKMEVGECWSPVTELSPIQDVSPSLEAAEQNMQSSEIGTTGQASRLTLNSDFTNGLPRVTSGTISGILADFNKQMEAMNTVSPTDEIHPHQRRSSLTGRRGSLKQSPATSKSVDSRSSVSAASSTATSSTSSTGSKVNESGGSKVSTRSDPARGSSESGQQVVAMVSGQSVQAPTHLAIPTKVTHEVNVAVSPVVEQTLHQQQMIIQQQQELIMLQKEIYQQQQRHQEQLQKQAEQTKPPNAGQTHNQNQPDNQAAKKSEKMSEEEEEDKRRKESLVRLAKAASSSASSTSTTHTASEKKKDRRRLPQPTIEEIQGAVQAISGQNSAFSAASHAVSRSSISMAASLTRPISPLIPRKNHVTAVPIISPAGRTRISASTVLTTATSTLMSTSVATSLPEPQHHSLAASHSAFASRIFSPMEGLEITETQSEAGGKKRRLPPVPLDEEPVTAALAGRILLRERLGRSATLGAIGSRSGLLMRSFSSMDNVPKDFIGSMSPRSKNITGNISPYSSLSDIANLINSSGALLDKQPLTSAFGFPAFLLNAGKPSALTSLPSSPSIGIQHSAYLKCLKNHLRDGLRSVEERRRLLESSDRDFYRRSDIDLQALTEGLPLSEAELFARKAFFNKKRAPLLRGENLDSRFANNVLPDEILPGMFKSYEYEFLDPTFRTQDSSMSGLYSSLQPTNRSLRGHFGPGYLKNPYAASERDISLERQGLETYQSRLDKGLRESFIPNFMENGDSRLTSGLGARSKFRRRSEGSLDETFLSYNRDMDPYNVNLMTQNTAYEDLHARSRPLLSGFDPTHSWHPSSYASEDEDEKISREEKAAKVRAEIARRKAQLIGSGRAMSDDFGSLLYLKDQSMYDKSQVEYPKSYVGDYFGQRTPSMGIRRPLHRDTYFSRSLDSGYEDNGQRQDLYGYRGRGLGMGRGQSYSNYQTPYSGNIHQSPQVSSASAKRKYAFPVKRILLTRDPKERPQDGTSCFGLKLIGGQPIPGSNGVVGAFVEKTLVGGVVDSLGEIREGDQVLEWNGIPLTNMTNEEVQRVVVSCSRNEEVELLLRRDFNLFESSYDSNMQMSGETFYDTHHQTSNDSMHPEMHPTTNGAEEVMYTHDCGGYVDDTEPEIGQQEGQYGHQRSDGSSQRFMMEDRNVQSANPMYSQEAFHQQQGFTYHDAQCPQNYLNQQNQARRSNYSYSNDSYLGPNVGSQPQVPSNHTNPEWESYHQAPRMIPHQQSIDGISLSDTFYEKRDFEGRENPLKAVSGQIQLQICYDHKAAILYVTIIQAQDLLRPHGEPPDPLVKCYLLPPRIIENQRRTRYCRQSCNPEWKQTMVYPQIEMQDLNKKYLEITVWSYESSQDHLFLGQVVLHLSDSQIYNEEANWYRLKPPDEDERNNHQEDWSNDRKRSHQIQQQMNDPEIHLDFRRSSTSKTIHAVSTKKFRFPGNKIIQALSQKSTANAPRTQLPKPKAIMN